MNFARLFDERMERYYWINSEPDHHLFKLMSVTWSGMNIKLTQIQCQLRITPCIHIKMSNPFTTLKWEWNRQSQRFIYQTIFNLSASSVRANKFQFSILIRNDFIKKDHTLPVFAANSVWSHKGHIFRLKNHSIVSFHTTCIANKIFE